MYTQDFYITEAVGNNAFSFSDRKNKKLFVPKLKKIKSFDEIKLLHSSVEKITFEEYDFNDVMQACYGLENLYEIDSNSLLNSLPFQGKGATGPKIYLVDNHNHVLYFWYLAREQGIISDNSILYHIDEHADLRDPGKYLLKPESQDLQKIFEYTNFFLNVGNYIVPAQKEGLIGEVIQIRSEEALKEYIETESGLNRVRTPEQFIILNLDLDFFQPELDYIDYELKKRVILDIAEKADLITVCTSPYFIDQERAVKVLKKIFDF